MDRKISQLPERVTAVLGIDVLPIVGNTASTPTNLRVQVKNFLNNLAIDFPQTTSSAVRVTANVSANAVSATLTGGEFIAQANSSVGFTVQSQVGMIARSRILNGNTTITGLMTAGLFSLDSGNSTVAAANTFGVIIEHTIANTAWSRAVSPRAFLGFKEQAGTNGNTTVYLFDIGAQGNTISADSANVNSTTMFTKANNTAATHKLKISVNGTDYWLLAANTI